MELNDCDRLVQKDLSGRYTRNVQIGGQMKLGLRENPTSPQRCSFQYHRPPCLPAQLRYTFVYAISTSHAEGIRRNTPYSSHPPYTPDTASDCAAPGSAARQNTPALDRQ